MGSATPATLMDVYEVEGIEHEFRAQLRFRGASDDPPAPNVDDDREVEEARSRRDVRDVSDPALVRRLGPELPVHQVWPRSGVGVSHGGRSQRCEMSNGWQPRPFTTCKLGKSTDRSSRCCSPVRMVARRSVSCF
jgi:hypothetical protein